MADGVAALPAQFRQRIENLSFVVEDWAHPDDMRETGTRAGSTLLGLYRGIPLTRRGSGYNLAMPDVIVLFQQPLQRIARDADHLDELVDAHRPPRGGALLRYQRCAPPGVGGVLTALDRIANLRGHRPAHYNLPRSSGEAVREEGLVPSDATPRLQIQHVDRPGRPLSYAVLGSGAPVLWLTPYAVPLRAQSAIPAGRQFIKELSERYRLLLIDDPHYVGPGEHDLPVPDGFLASQVSNLIAVLDAANIERCHISASFLTTIPAVALAGRHPDRVASLMLWDGLLSGASLPVDGGVRDLMSITRSTDLGVATRSWIGVAGIAGGAKMAREQRELIHVRPASWRRWP